MVKEQAAQPLPGELVGADVPGRERANARPARFEQLGSDSRRERTVWAGQGPGTPQRHDGVGVALGPFR